MVGPQLPPQIYPLGQVPTGADPRFTVGLVTAVADVLSSHGYPNLIRARSGRDFVELRQALFGFLYGSDRDPGPHATTCSVWRSPDCDCGGEHR